MASSRGASSEDASTPLFFLLALLLCVVAPWTLAVLWALLFPGRREVARKFPDVTEEGFRVRNCQTQAMASKRKAEVERLRSRSAVCTRGFACRAAVLVALWCWLIYIVVQLQRVLANSSLYANFDPYELLGLGRSASKSEVRKAFHKMSLKYHPDKNPEPSAPEKFMLVKKAFDALTNPVAKRNYALYGNPDGPTRVELSVALPTFSKEHQGPVLVLFVVLFVLGVPLSVLCCCMGGGEGEKCPNGVFRDTMEALQKGVTPQLDVRGAQALLLASRESTGCAVRPEEREEEVLRKLLEEARPKAAKGGAQPSKAELLFLAHVQRRHALLTERLREDLEELLPKWSTVALALADLAVRQSFAEAIIAAIDLYRCIVQALEPGVPTTANALLQVPHFNAERLKQWRKGPRRAADLAAFAELPAEERRSGLEALGFTPQELLDAEEFAKAVPRMSVAEAVVVVEGESNICQDDIATLRVRLVRTNLADGEAIGAAHTPLFPSASVPEAWWVCFTLPGKGAKTRCVRTLSRKREVVVELKFRVPSVGKCRCALLVACEAYAGLDVEQQVSFQAQAAASPGKGEERGDEDEEASEEEG